MGPQLNSQSTPRDLKYHWNTQLMAYEIAKPGDYPVYRENQWGTDFELDDATPSDPRMDPNRTGKNSK